MRRNLTTARARLCSGAREYVVTERLDLFYNTYGHFTEQVLAAVRAETFGRDIGQNSWLTADEYDRFIPWLSLAPGQHVLEVASGAGGPALYLAGQTTLQNRLPGRIRGTPARPRPNVEIAFAELRRTPRPFTRHYGVGPHHSAQ
jgi:hypothetical protein